MFSLLFRSAIKKCFIFRKKVFFLFFYVICAIWHGTRHTQNIVFISNVAELTPFHCDHGKRETANHKTIHPRLLETVGAVNNVVNTCRSYDNLRLGSRLFHLIIDLEYECKEEYKVRDVKKFGRFC